jgi:hypothetical protein
MLQAFHRIPPFPNGHVVGPEKLIDHGGPIGYSQAFSTSSQSEVVRAYFADSLIARGWTLARVRENRVGKEITTTFCMGRISARITVKSLAQSGSRYSVAALWTPDREDQANYCADTQ